MDTLPLPPRPDLAQYRKRAKDLVAASNSTDPDAIRAWATDWLATLARLRGVTITPFVQGSFDRAVERIHARVRAAQSDADTQKRRFVLADAQFLIAQAHGFPSWSEFTTHLGQVASGNSERGEFEVAVDAVVGGDVATLAALLRSHPELVRARSARVHHATLLHYVAANGVEDFRQVTPPNAVAVARLLLDAGSVVDAVADTYGGGSAQTTMNLLVSSAHPAGAGLQSALVEVLVDYGAAVNGLEDDGSPLMTALAFGYSGAAATLVKRGARVDNVVAAAALGDVELVRRFVIDGSTLSPEARFVETEWLKVERNARAHLGLALVWACRFKRNPIVELLLDRGVDPAARDRDDMTALHWAAAAGALPAVQLLLARGAPLEVENCWGGTVLSSTLFFARNQPMEGADYAAVVAALVAAGADASRVDAGDLPS